MVEAEALEGQVLGKATYYCRALDKAVMYKKVLREPEEPLIRNLPHKHHASPKSASACLTRTQTYILIFPEVRNSFHAFCLHLL